MSYLSSFASTIVRFVFLWMVDGIALLIAVAIFPGFTFVEAENVLVVVIEAFSAAFLLSIVNLMIRPFVLLLARPLGFVAMFVLGFLVNALALILTSWLLPLFQISGLLSAIVGGLIFAAINVLLTGILEVNDEGSFYQGLIERLARRNSFMDKEPDKRGLVMVEIDGLSFHHLQKAIADGRMPTLQRLIESEGYELSLVDCGIPSQTSACQAGIMFGDNTDIPAFRWYDKDEKKLYVSGSDASVLNSRYAQGKGLMRGGSSINNMLNGDADKSLLTLADLFVADDEEKKRRAEDVYLICLNPYFLSRTIILFLGDALREVWEGWRQRRKNVQPRLNRLAHGYPFVRAATTIFMRDIAANLTILDIIRGAPSIYVTWPGYDEVAHHSGPWTSDAFHVLASYDKVIARIHKTIQEKAPRPYDFIVLSDHGQAFGSTFKQRYGVSLKEFIEEQLPQGTTVAESMGGDTGITSLTAVSGELENIQQSQVGGVGGRALARQSQKLIERQENLRETTNVDGSQDEPAQVTAYGSGNLAQVYFDLFPRKISLSELELAYPGMVDALVQHEGIGIVSGYGDDGSVIVMGKNGTLNLKTGEVTGEDPLLLYAPQDPNAYGRAALETRHWQVQRVMDFPHAGDLMVISTVYADGTVAAFEELIGNHGGLGGEQTDAFLFHPPDMEVTPTRNATDVYHILNNRRELPLAASSMTPTLTEPEMDAWSLANLWAGVKDLRIWLILAIRAFVLDRAAYREIADNKRMTGPALLLGIGIAIGTSLIRADEDQVLGTVVSSTFSWFLAVLAVYAAGRLLTKRGNYTRTFRTLGFAQVASLIEFASLIPALAPVAILVSTIVSFIAVWMATAVAHDTRGWRTIVLPVVMVIVLILIPLLMVVMLSGAILSFESVLEQIGLIPPG